jgi:hypothetical protein
VNRARRVEGAGEQLCRLVAAERGECDVCASQEFARLAGTACERGLGELGAWLARAEHEQDSPPVQRVRVAELAKEAGVVERRGFESRAGVRGCCLDLFCVGAQRDAFAADVDLHRLGEAVEEALEGGDKRCLLGGAPQFEAGAARAEQTAVAAICEFDQPALEDPSHGNVESGRLRLQRRAM